MTSCALRSSGGDLPDSDDTYYSVQLSSACLVGLSLAIVVPIWANPSIESVVTPVTGVGIATLSNADQILIRSCMQRAGFRYWPIPQNKIDPVQRYPYVVASRRWARIHGFGGMPEGQPPGTDSNTRYVATLSVTRNNIYYATLLGGPHSPGVIARMPTGGILGHSSLGCQADAETELYRNLGAWFRASSVALFLPRLWQYMTIRAPQFQTSMAVWSKCMHMKGFAYSSPSEAARAFPRPSYTRPAPAEVDAAVAEAGCADSTGFATTAERLNRKYSAEVQREFRSVLRSTWTLGHLALPRARSVLNRSHERLMIEALHPARVLSDQYPNQWSERRTIND